MQPAEITIISVIGISLLSLIGITTLSLKEKALKKIIFYLVAFAAGALLGDAFFHILPETAKTIGFETTTAMLVLSGIIVFFITEKILYWHHCHNPNPRQHIHYYSYLNLIGDSIHNFIDGIIIAGSYLAGTAIGITTTIAVAVHEIAQEIGDFAILIHGGMTRKQAIIYNFLSALTAVIGAIIGLLLGAIMVNFTNYLLPFTAGAFIYIASTDLIPEIKKEEKTLTSIMQLICFLLGIGAMAMLAL